MGSALLFKVRYYQGGAVGITRTGSTTEVYRIPMDTLTPVKNPIDIANRFVVYILYAYNPDGRDYVYVGKSKNGIYNRPKSHKDKFSAETCYLLTQGLTNTFFNDGTIQYLEHRLNQKVNQCNAFINTTETTNFGTANEDDEDACNVYLEEADIMLKVLGLDLDTVYPDSQALAAAVPQSDALTPLPEQQADEKIGAYVKRAVKNLLDSDFEFTDELMDRCGSIEETGKYTKSNIYPMFWILKDGETRLDMDLAVRRRYWADENSKAGRHFMVYSQWYDDDSPNGPKKADFVAWYASLNS